MASAPKHALSIAELSKLAGVSTTTWKAHVAQGCPVPKTTRGLRPWLKRYHEWRTKHGKVAPTKSAPPIDRETMEAKRHYAKLRVSLMEVQLRREVGELIPRKEVVDFCARAVLGVRLRLDSIKTKMGGRLQHSTTDVIVEELGREFDAMCDDFATGMRRAHDQSPTAVNEAPAAGSGSGDSPKLAPAKGGDH